MIDRPLIFTRASLDAFLSASSTSNDRLALQVPEQVRDLVTRLDTPEAVYVIHASDDDSSPRVVFAYRGCLELLPDDGDVLTTALQRASRLAVSAARPPVRLPPAWSSYHAGNLVAFFAVTREMGAFRWIAQLRPADSEDVYFCRITHSSQPVHLESFHVSLADYRRPLQGWTAALEHAAKRFAYRARTTSVQVVETVDLEATTYGAVVGGRNYSSWLRALTSEQKRFLERPASVSTKLRGPAGSGKTLLLELKALHETYACEPPRRAPRILFVTHSWAMAEQVDAALVRLHDRDAIIDNISVFPLLSIAQDLLPAERQGRGFDLLGEDNLSGKICQLGMISRILDHTVAHDWLAYEDRCTPAFAERATAVSGSPEHRALVWDLMQEFACVLSAHGILPGVNAARHYLPLHRMPWMMPLATDGEKLFVLEIYTAVVNELREQRLLTSDQLINDFLNYLETFAWNLRRAEAGFDLIFVDELHLFNEQERMALSFLSRDPDAHPVMFMALDPRQSPAEVYAGASVPALAASDSGEADAALGTVEALDLTTVHRFSPEILALVRHINNSYPALDLGDDWALDLDRLETSAASSGRRPTVSCHVDRAAEASAVLADATARLASRGAEERVAIVLVDTLAVAHYQDARANAGSVLLLEGRDDVDALRYSRRAIVLSPAEYVAGLQFADVIVAGFPPKRERRANLGHERRRLLSLLYLAVSRATTDVAIHVNMADGGVPEVLETALERGVAEAGE